MPLISKDLGAMKMPLLALAIAVAASFAMIAFSSNQHSQSEKQYRDQLTALQEARTRYQRSGDERALACVSVRPESGLSFRSGHPCVAARRFKFICALTTGDNVGTLGNPGR